MTMTIEEMKAAIAQAQAENLAKARELKSKRDRLRTEAEEAHIAFMKYCEAKDLSAKGIKG